LGENADAKAEVNYSLLVHGWGKNIIRSGEWSRARCTKKRTGDC